MHQLREQLILASAVQRAGRSTEFYRAQRRGGFVRLVQGVHLPTGVWDALDADERFLARIHALAAVARHDLVFSHLSAAALWGLPIVGPWPNRIEVATQPARGGRSTVGYLARESDPFPVAMTVGDVLATSLARTVVDVGRTAQLAVSVPMADAALTRLAEGDLWREFEAVRSPRGQARCRRMLELADGRSGSPGESLSRVTMHLGGLPRPELQHDFHDGSGLAGIVDFWWPDVGLIGEFDGAGKYLRAEMLRGSTTADALLAEKRREDRLRAINPRLTRWGWEVARSVPLLVHQLRGAGLR